MPYDNVKCSNCEFDGLVNIGDDECPKCSGSGCLSWKDGEVKEVID